MSHRTLFHATGMPTAKAIARDQQVIPKLDSDASIPGREQYKLYFATSPDILDAVPHATAVVEMDLPTSVTLFEGEGDDPEKGWRELVYQASTADPVPVSNAKIVKTR